MLLLQICTFYLLVWCCFANESKEEEKVKYAQPKPSGHVHFAEPFHQEAEFEKRWAMSAAEKDGVDSAISKYDGEWKVEEPTDNPLVGDKGLVLKTKAKHHAAVALLDEPFEFTDKPFILQYEVRFQNVMECGGAYIKLISESPNFKVEDFNDKTPYTIMFGPDKCGQDSKLHFIFRHKNPKNGVYEEKHAKKPTTDFSKIFDDKKTHLVTLIILPDNSFSVMVDKSTVNSGSLLTSFEPPVQPPSEIDDPEDIRPEDWDEREMIPDPTATKPEDWDEDAPKRIVDPNDKKPANWQDDEPENVPDPTAEPPKDWDTEEDGEWEAPLIPNPKCQEAGCGKWEPAVIDNPNYKGKWSPQLIVNPAYQGIWKPKKIPNPDFFVDNEPFKMTTVVALGFELWSMTSDILFDNIIVSNDESVVNDWTAQTWDLKQAQEKTTLTAADGGIVSALIDATEEKPWLWAIYVIVVFLPFILIGFFCFPNRKDLNAQRKKDDEPTPDDDHTNEEQDQPGEDVAGEAPEKTEDDVVEDDGDAKDDEEQDESPPDASPRTRSARRKARKDA